ncbi:hypothetical protein C2G38_2218146 [Gigaspora rosea]|uniref:Peptidase S1 domain-containing protein n=1 Tax=Gigaspora rosea TaxID=44941 RepID=A0A397U705_9GLOM|nr:hypothetical protein C2G38_2218146 [Gigaspora rosea]
MLFLDEDNFGGIYNDFIAATNSTARLNYKFEEITNPNNMEPERRNNNIVVKIMAGDGLYKIDTRNSTCTTDSEKYRELFIDDDIAASHYGCGSDYFSHVKCGCVKSLNGFASIQKHFHENLLIVSLAFIKGDSGSPLFSYKQDLTRASLNGIVSEGACGDIVNDDIVSVITIRHTWKRW